MILLKGWRDKMRPLLAIFDLDGTLFDTSLVNFYAYREALAPEGVNLEKEYFAKYCNGYYYRDFVPKLTGEFNDEQLERVHINKKKAYINHVDKAKQNIHLIRYAKLIKRTGYKTAIVTTASRQNTDDILNAFNIKDIFDLILTQEDVVNKKPDPEGFFKAMEFFNADPEDTVIFEDSNAGIKAAMATGATVLSVCYISKLK